MTTSRSPVLALAGAVLSLAACSSGSSSTDPCVPAVETCNGLDDDCDGVVDDGFALGSACSSGVGACLAAGHLACAWDGTHAECDAVPGDPSAETCNQIDDDCNGSTDDGLAACCVPTATRPCGTTTGACVQGTETCSGAGAWGACLDGNGAPVVLPGTVAEACNAIDDDCDGLTDEELQAALCPLQAGVCAGSTTICDGGEWLACGQESYGPAWEETETMCDGEDNDCDGTTDEGLRFTAYRDADFDGFGSSSAQVCFVFAGWSRTGGDCDDADASVHPGAPEVCGNLRDDDCDTFVDEAC